jgi:spermidine synthase
MSEQYIDLELIHEEKTDYADLCLYDTEDGKLVLTLDTFIQFVEGKDEEIYHDMLVRPAFEKNTNATKFLILGGGDGLVARNIFRLKPEAEITLVDIDKRVVDLFMFEPRLVKLNEGSLPYVDKYYEDALEWVPNCKKKFDIIICDFPDPNSENLKKLYSKEFLTKVTELLENQGVIAIQTHHKWRDKTLNVVEDILGNAEAIDYEMPFLEEASIINARLYT